MRRQLPVLTRRTHDASALVGTQLVRLALRAMQDDDAEEARAHPHLCICLRSRGQQVVLEAEATNTSALRLYSRLGFVRDKRLARYYLSGSDAFRLKLLLPPTELHSQQ